MALELKLAPPGKRSPRRALDDALAQVAAQDYTAELLARGAAPVHCFAIALRGKQAFVRRAGRPRSR